MSSQSLLKTNLLAMQLKEVAPKDLLLLDYSLKDIYTFDNGLFKVVLPEGSAILKKTIKDLLGSGVNNLFVHNEDYELISERLKNELVRITRSLSVGDPAANAKKQVNLLSQNMSELYKDPLDDENLKMQYQCTVNLGKFLLEHKKFLPEIYSDLLDNKHHFVISQPMLASLALIGFLKHLNLFHEKDIEMLFLTSYFKDIGMSFIPEDKLEKDNLSLKEKKVFSKHADNSQSILEGRIPLGRSHLGIIRNHHYLNRKIDSYINKKPYVQKNTDLIGLETTLVAVFDIIIAMVSERPYREQLSLFQTLELIKEMMADDYPKEFKALVNYLRIFFTKIP